MCPRSITVYTIAHSNILKECTGFSLLVCLITSNRPLFPAETRCKQVCFWACAVQRKQQTNDVTDYTSSSFSAAALSTLPVIPTWWAELYPMATKNWALSYTRCSCY